ncbi:KTSC domain-containing protein [Natrinema soli]|uniref:KTSC domain-containing protein n=1 Tax=Natrinema soli TaxID=1930624 RepID=A0ABD5SG72_9EURY
MKVKLQDRSVYQYIDVPEETYRGLMGTKSLDRYFNAHIRGHSYHRIQ